MTEQMPTELRPVPQEARRQIYFALRARGIEPETEFKMSQMGDCLLKAGISYRELGFDKLKYIMPALSDFASARVDESDIAKNFLVTLHAVPEWETDFAEQMRAAAEQAVIAPQDSDIGEWEDLVAQGFTGISEEMRCRLPETFDSVNLTLSAQNLMLSQITGEHLTGMEGLLTSVHRAALAEDYTEALETGVLRPNERYDDAVDIPTHFRSAQGNLLFLSISPAREDSVKPWFTAFCGYVAMTARRGASLSYSLPPEEKIASESASYAESYRRSVPDSTETRPDPPETLEEDDVYIQRNALTAMDGYLNDMPFDFDNQTMPDEEAVRALKDAYIQAKQENRLFPVMNGYVFHTTLETPHGQPLQAMLRPSLPGKGKTDWTLTRIEPVPPRIALDRWAHMGDWPQVLRELAGKALAENWSFGKAHDRSILKGYLCYTFYRLQRENKVLLSADGRMAAFNTGLVNNLYDDIYAVFMPNTGSDGIRWRFRAFCVEGDSPWGKSLTQHFDPPPQPAQYFQAEDLLYDWHRAPRPSYEHITLERLYRWPADVLRDRLRGTVAIEYLRGIEYAAPAAKSDAYKKVETFLRDNANYQRLLGECLDTAINRALKRVRWNYQSALPSYFPTRNSVSLMLPLDLTGTGRVDFALVAERQQNGAYIGQTILTLDQAYVDARLVCRPDKDWLNNETIISSGEDALDDDLETED